MYIKVLYNIKNNQNNKKGVECGCKGLDLTQNHLKLEKKIRKKKKVKQLCLKRDLNPRPSDYRSCS